MIKKISIDQLRIGMYIHDLNCSWINHPFARNQFKVDEASVLNKILGAGVKEFTIDTALGVDVMGEKADAGEFEQETEQDEEALPDLSSLVPDIIIKFSPAEEFGRAKELYSSASKLMQDMMKDVRLGKQIEMEQCDPIVDNIVDSMFNAPSALLPLAQIKTRDEYTFQHSVSVAALAVAFGRVLNMPRDEIREVAMGGLLHDVGKAMVPGRILNKPGKLDEAEFAIIKNHVVYTAKLLNDTHGISKVAFNAAAQHHERFDGTGYPNKLEGDQISIHGQMLAIVDVYDAITSIRVYHKGMPPREALQKMFVWCGTHFSDAMVRAFIKGVGIYPAGSLVRMESEKLGIVREVQPDNILQPVVQMIYDCKKLSHITPMMVDLSASNDKITSHESFEKWGIDQSRWAAAHV